MSSIPRERVDAGPDVDGVDPGIAADTCGSVNGRGGRGHPNEAAQRSSVACSVASWGYGDRVDPRGRKHGSAASEMKQAGDEDPVHLATRLRRWSSPEHQLARAQRRPPDAAKHLRRLDRVPLTSRHALARFRVQGGFGGLERGPDRSNLFDFVDGVVRNARRRFGFEHVDKLDLHRDGRCALQRGGELECTCSLDSRGLEHRVGRAQYAGALNSALDVDHQRERDLGTLRGQRVSWPLREGAVDKLGGDQLDLLRRGCCSQREAQQGHQGRRGHVSLRRTSTSCRSSRRRTCRTRSPA